MIIGVSATAQMMPDSTVQFCSYWSPGEKQTYHKIEREYKVVGNDTTEMKINTEIHILEVLAQTDSTYKLKVTYTKPWSSDPAELEVLNHITETAKDMSVYLTTDEFGSILSINNLNELVAYQMTGLEPAIEVIRRRKGDNVTEEEMAQIREVTAQSLNNTEVIKKSIMEETGRMLFFHGTRMKLGEEYSGTTSVDSPILGKDAPLVMDVVYWIDEDYSDDYSAVARSYSSANEKTMTDFTLEAYNHIMVDAGLSKKEVKKGMKEMKQLKLSMEESLATEVHLNTGWPLATYFYRSIYGNKNGVTTEKVNEMEIMIELQNTSEE